MIEDSGLAFTPSEMAELGQLGLPKLRRLLEDLSEQENEIRRLVDRDEQAVGATP